MAFGEADDLPEDFVPSLVVICLRLVAGAPAAEEYVVQVLVVMSFFQEDFGLLSNSPGELMEGLIAFEDVGEGLAVDGPVLVQIVVEEVGEVSVFLFWSVRDLPRSSCRGK
ncbi:hypothetical protein Q8791_16485 [Nocardiopsis sp. CT-R113]|uniref:Uncharacterized protein n=1 Tax=Nocardiopsis codii TaxID=3065942 RepID=A0ABU7K9C0_9ACTN|nr:hypothetical protein [Nocardiopsis sp. CT-R113]MEE2038822.1 hypothetical protein [Nocardiopsis sp. CT-R113]